MKVKNMLNANDFEKNYEVNNEPSLTIPDLTMSVREILERYSRGLPIDQKIPIYDESESEEYFPDPRYMDLAEREEYKNNFREELQHIKTKVEKPKEDVQSESE